MIDTVPGTTSPGATSLALVLMFTTPEKMNKYQISKMKFNEIFFSQKSLLLNLKTRLFENIKSQIYELPVTSASKSLSSAASSESSNKSVDCKGCCCDLLCAAN